MVPESLLLALAVAGGLSLLSWLVVLLHPVRPWDLEPVAESAPPPREPAAWPPVAVLVPARNERSYLPRTLPALLAQDYPGEWRLVLVDDRSDDGTGEVAAGLAAEAAAAERVRVLAGAPLPPGWAGKVWALEQGAVYLAGEGAAPAYLLLTDADIRYAEGSLQRLVAEAEEGRLALTSRMARLHVRSLSERLLIPPFLFLFDLLYPMRWVNDPSRPLAAAAGGCVLVRRDALERAGGFAAIAGEVIDDVNLARRVKRLGEPIRLAVSRRDVASLREHGFGSSWRMVRRTAFAELRYSWALLAATLAGLVLLFPLPAALVALAAALGAARAVGALDVSLAWCLALGLPGLAAWGLMSALFARTVRFFDLNGLWALTLPLSGTLYGGMTLDSGLRHALGRGRAW